MLFMHYMLLEGDMILMGDDHAQTNACIYEGWVH